ncbi:MAG: DUF983 domain-containing protein [Alphaproteobacteria bacterium]|nr:DUF983 domain-containing protein [Alphaproteobacteria bacterium]
MSGAPPAALRSPLSTGLRCRCPRCGQGKLFAGYLTVAPVCGVCGLDLSRHDSGDGPAVFVILILGLAVVGLALVAEITLQPPLWLHMLVWTPVVIGGSLALLRPLKGLMIALQYRNQTAGFEG